MEWNYSEARDSLGEFAFKNSRNDRNSKQGYEHPKANGAD